MGDRSPLFVQSAPFSVAGELARLHVTASPAMAMRSGGSFAIEVEALDGHGNRVRTSLHCPLRRALALLIVHRCCGMILGSWSFRCGVTPSARRTARASACGLPA